jgi:hypothetical protein
MMKHAYNLTIITTFMMESRRILSATILTIAPEENEGYIERIRSYSRFLLPDYLSNASLPNA